MKNKMRAIRVHEFGGPEVMQFEWVPVPEVGPGQVLIRVDYAGVNMVDSYYRRGWYRPPAMPFIPGIEVAGIVAAVGPGVEDVAVSQRVVAVMAPGGYAEYVAVPSGFVVPIPDCMETLLAAGTALQGLTAWFLSRTTHRVVPGQTILVHSAASGVAGYLVPLARQAGARVIGAVSNQAKCAHAQSRGCREVVLYSDGDFADAVRRLTDGMGADVVYDFSGAETYLRSLKCLKPRGMLVLCGQSSGPAAEFDPQLLRTNGSLYLTRPTLTDYMKPIHALREMANGFWNLVAVGVLEPMPISQFPLAEAVQAHEHLADRSRIAKVVLSARRNL